MTDINEHSDIVLGLRSAGQSLSHDAIVSYYLTSHGISNELIVSSILVQCDQITAFAERLRAERATKTEEAA